MARFLSREEEEMLAEVMNIASGRAAAALARLLGQRVRLQVVQVRALTLGEAEHFLAQQVGVVGGAVAQHFTNEMHGSGVLVLPHQEAVQIIRLLLGEPKDLETLSALEESALAEVGNIVLGAYLAVLGNLLEHRLFLGVPRVFFNMPGAHLAQLLLKEMKTGAYALVLTTTLSTGATELVFYTLLVLIVQADHWPAILEQIRRHLSV